MKFDDYLMRAIQEFAQRVARILKALRNEEEEVAESEIAGAYDALLAHDRVFLDMVDAGTLANLLGAPEKVRVLAQLSLLEAKLCTRRGEATRADVLAQRARALLAIARRGAAAENEDEVFRDIDAL